MLSERNVTRLVYVFIYMSLEPKCPWGENGRIQMFTIAKCQGQRDGASVPLMALFCVVKEKSSKKHSFERLANVPRAALFAVVTAAFSKDSVPLGQWRRQQELQAFGGLASIT